MSEFTNQEVESHFITREIDTVAVKGKAAGVKIYELICSKDDADFVRPIAHDLGSVFSGWLSMCCLGSG